MYRTKQIIVTLSTEERDEFKELAKKENMPMTKFILKLFKLYKKGYPTELVANANSGYIRMNKENALLQKEVNMLNRIIDKKILN